MSFLDEKNKLQAKQNLISQPHYRKGNQENGQGGRSAVMELMPKLVQGMPHQQVQDYYQLRPSLKTVQSNTAIKTCKHLSS